MRPPYLCVLPFCLGLASAGQAQQLQLFEPLAPAAAGEDRYAPVPGPQLAAPASTEASLRLRSSSRFGDDYHLVLVDAAGTVLELRWRSGETVPIPQHTGYAVVGVRGTEVSLQQPGTQPCVPDVTAGIRCLDTQTAILTLVTLSPLPGGSGSSRGPQSPLAEPDALGQEFFSDQMSNAVLVNPFIETPLDATVQVPEQQAREQRARARAERLQQFQVERIPEDQVPPGMRLVRTPFGDRLVPVRQ